LEQSQESQSSVFDFVYLDIKRIALYFSQLNKYGNLTGLVRSVQHSDEDKSSFRAQIGPRSVRAELRGEASEGQQTGIQRHYDTQWKQPVEFLKELQDRDMVKRTFEEVEVGDIFILPGNLSLIDIGMFTKVWEVVANQAKAQARAAAGTRPSIGQDRRKQRGQAGSGTLGTAGTSAAGQVEPLNEWVLRMFGALNQPVFLNFQSKGRRFWAMADPSAMIADGAGLVYKHGTTIPGTWHLLAILDALDSDPGTGEPWLKRAGGVEPNEIGVSFLNIMSEFRTMMGRPIGAYGVTPLAIFREIGHTRI
jgi:hypothetical protein